MCIYPGLHILCKWAKGLHLLCTLSYVFHPPPPSVSFWVTWVVSKCLFRRSVRRRLPILCLVCSISTLSLSLLCVSTSFSFSLSLSFIYSVCLCLRLCLFLFFCLSVLYSVCLFVCPSVCMSLLLSFPLLLLFSLRFSLPPLPSAAEPAICRCGACWPSVWRTRPVSATFTHLRTNWVGSRLRTSASLADY